MSHKTIKGKIEKIARRFGIYRLVVQAEPKRVIADFDAPPETKTKLRQGSAVEIAGVLKSEGYESICLENCRVLPA